jgi:hypothetical protein
LNREILLPLLEPVWALVAAASTEAAATEAVPAEGAATEAVPAEAALAKRPNTVVAIRAAAVANARRIELVIS